MKQTKKRNWSLAPIVSRARSIDMLGTPVYSKLNITQIPDLNQDM